MPAADIAYNSFFYEWEIRLEEWIQAAFPASLLKAVSHLSVFGEELVLIALLGFLYWTYDKKAGKHVGIGILMANIWNPLIKNIAIRRRPYFESEEIDLLRLVEPGADADNIAAQGYSFPSGHSAGAVAAYGGLSRYYGKKALTVVAVILPLLVGISRVVVGAHFPTDVIAGWTLGLFIILFVPWLEKKTGSRAVFFGILLLTSAPGLFFCRSTDYYTGFGMLIGFIAAVPFEERYVRFENTKSPLRGTLRVLGGLMVYLGLNKAMKLPFSKEFLHSVSAPSFALRCARYAVIIFVELAVYPILFRYTARIGRSEEKEEGK